MGTTRRNDRKVKAGVILANDPTISQAQALIQAGYSPATASTPTAKGLAAEACIKAAEAAGAVPSTSSLRDLSRRLLEKKIQTALVDDKQLAKIRLSEAARTADVTEKHYGQQGEALAVRTFTDRLEAAKLLQQIMSSASGNDSVNDSESSIDGEATGAADEQG